ncbi:MAG: hypothetical protein LBK99_08220 [Opitutaceae bacterium]|jgi:hypothetical protein|nr:hypothetical protein [Opitutaceae bacterium]
MRTYTYGSGADDNTVTILDGKLVRKRTYIFAARTALTTIREVGWSWSTGAGGNLFGRDVLPGAGIILVPGQQLKIVLKLAITITPLVQTVMPGPFWTGGGGQVQLENLGYDYQISSAKSYMDTVLSDSEDTFKVPNPSKAAGALSGTAKNIQGQRLAYEAGTYQARYRATFTLNDGNMETIRCLAMGWWDWNTFYPVLRIIFDQPQEKTSDNTLTIVWVLAWGRVLIN